MSVDMIAPPDLPVSAQHQFYLVLLLNVPPVRSFETSSCIHGVYSENGRLRLRKVKAENGDPQ